MTEFVMTVLGGGPDLSEVVTLRKTVLLRKKIKELSKRDCAPPINKFKIMLLVEGELTKYKQKGGVHNTKYYTKKQEVSIDVIIKSREWKSRANSDEEIDDLLRGRIFLGYKTMVEYLEKKKVDIQGEELLEKLERLLDLS